MKIGKKRPAPLSSDSMAIMREKARRQGYYFIPELSYWSEDDRDIYLQYVTQINILYIHGLSSSGTSETAERLRRYLPDDVIFSPDLPVDPDEALATLPERTSTVTPAGRFTGNLPILDITVTVEGNEVKLTRPTDQPRHRSLHGLYRALINNMVVGVNLTSVPSTVTVMSASTFWLSSPRGK